MTNEEAISVLNDYDINFERHTAEEVAEAHEMAIKALKPQQGERTEERTETHACDRISRKDIGLTNLEILMCNGDYKEALKMLLDKIEKAPSVTPQPKTGHWILSGGYWRCSECKEKALLKLDKATGGCREYEPVRSKYCPECGVKMQEVQK